MPCGYEPHHSRNCCAIPWYGEKRTDDGISIYKIGYVPVFLDRHLKLQDLRKGEPLRPFKNFDPDPFKIQVVKFKIQGIFEVVFIL